MSAARKAASADGEDTPTVFNLPAANAAADDAFHERDGGAQVPANEDAARAAVEALAALFAGLPKPIRKALASAKGNAARLSSDRLQGLAEIVQNADDLHATEVRFQLASGDQGPEILAAHDGTPVVMADLMGLATPWLSPKADDPASTGRFGIGLMTLQSLGPELHVHSGFFHFSLGSPTLATLPIRLPPAAMGTAEWTLFSVPLEPGVEDELDLEDWVREWGQAALLFLRHVRRVVLLDREGQVAAELFLTADPPCSIATDPAVSRYRARTGDGLAWTVYRQDLPTPASAARFNKAHDRTSPIAVGFPDGCEDAGFLHAGLPVEPVGLPFRMSGQFDPLANRQGLDADGTWNAMLGAALAHLWVTAALDVASTDPAAVWAVVPDPQAAAGRWPGGRLGRVLQQGLLADGLTAFAASLRLPAAGGQRHLADLAVESPALEHILTAEDTAGLAGTDAALPPDCRDSRGRWREVLSDLASIGAPCGVAVTLPDALSLLAGADRDVQFRIDLAAAALDAGLGEELAATRCVVDSDGQILQPPDPDAAHALVEGEVHRVLDDLALGRRLHPAFGSSEAGRSVGDWLARRGSLLRSPDVRMVLARLSDAGLAGKPLPGKLNHQQVLVLRDALEQLVPADRADLGSGIGAAIRLDAVRYGEDGNADVVAAHPAQSYLIEKEVSSWFVAAGRTAGLTWLDRRYSTALSKAHAGGGMGAQRLFRLLGAQVAPRLIADARAEPRFKHLARGVPAHAGTPARQQRLAGMDATHTLNDHVSPDLQAVLRDLGADRNQLRRLKSVNAVLATLAGAWQAWGDLTAATAANAYGQWLTRGEVPAAFLYDAAAAKWLANGASGLSAPQDLLQGTAVNVGHFGTAKNQYLHPKLSGVGRGPVLDALGVTGDPPASQLLAWLRELAENKGEDTQDAAVAGRAAAYSQALARMVKTPPGRTVGDVSVQRLRDAFSRDSGLVHTNVGWRRPSIVFTGPPVFGDRAAFAPTLPGTDRLWRLLGLKPPGARHARQVLSDIAAEKKPPDADTEFLMLETLRLLASVLDTADGQQLRLQRLSLWTSKGWAQRPVFAVANSRLSAALGSLVPIWLPGGAIDQFATLLPRLAITEVTANAVSIAAGVTGDIDEDATDIFAAAVAHLQSDLARNDAAAERSMWLSWEDLARFSVVVAPDLAVTVSGLDLTPVPKVPVRAYVDVASETLFVTDLAALGRVGGGGQAVAALSSMPERRISQPWRAAWDAAIDDRQAHILLTARAREQARARAAVLAAAHLQDLSQAAAQSRAAKNPPGAFRAAGSSKAGSAAATKPAAAPRNLIEVDSYALVETNGTVSPASTPDDAGGGTGARKAGGLKEPDMTRRPPASGRGRGPVNYTTEEKEERALGLVMQALGKDNEAIRDQRGVGADAVDDLRRFFELKTHAGPEPPDITLTDAESQRALTEDLFFLVVVSNLEEGRGDPAVRFIVDPMRTLNVKAAGSIRLGPLTDAPGLTYMFRRKRR